MAAAEPSTRALLLSPHPFVLEEWGRWARERDVVPEPVRLNWGPTPLRSPADLPDAAVCVLDACFPAASLETVVSGMVSARPGIRVIVVSEPLPPEVARPLLRRGIKGLLTYADAPSQLLHAVLAVARGGIWVPRGLLSDFLDALLTEKKPPRTPTGAGVSRREADVMDGLLRNLSNKEIANRLNISERTVKFHVSNLLEKFAVQRRADLILLSADSNRGMN